MLALASCKDDISNVSPGVKDSGQLEGALLVDTFRLEGSTNLYDSCFSSETAGLVVGNYQAPAGLTGLAYAEGYFDYSLPNFTDQISDSATFDSLIIRVPYVWTQTPAVGTGLTVELHALRTPLGKEKVFFTHNKEEYEPEVLATARVFDTSTVHTSGTLTFLLNNPDPAALGPRLLARGKSAAFGATYADNLAFSATDGFHGFALVPVGSGTPVARIITSSGTMVLTSSFKAGSKTKDLRSFPLNSAYSRWHSYVQGVRTGTDLESLTKLAPLPATQANGNRVYVQNLTALWGKLDFPTYAATRQAHPELTLIRAILELPADPILPQYNGPVPQLFCWQGSADRLALGRNGSFTGALGNGTSGSSTASDLHVFYYDATTHRYLVDMTNYLLGIEKGTARDAGLWITAPVDLPVLAPFSFSLYPGTGNRTDHARLRTYFVALER